MKTPKAHNWKSNKQPMATLLTCKAECMALAQVTQEALYFTQLLNEMNPLQEYTPIMIFGESQGAKDHFIRDILHNGSISIIYCPTTDMLTNIMTKTPTWAKLKKQKKDSKNFYSYCS